MVLFDIFLYLISFVAVWIGAGLIVVSVEDLSHKLNISSFATSFFVLGILTSIPEAMVGVNALVDNDPAIFVGNLIGASLVLFVLVIPILAILGNGIILSHQLNSKKLLLSLLVIIAPVFLIIDNKVSYWEGVFLILLYFILFYSIEKKKGLLEKIRDRIVDGKTHILVDSIKILIGVLIVFVASRIIVDKTIVFSEIIDMSPYLISLLVLSVGTNLPELSLAIRAVSLGKKEIALGDYVGSAAADTLMFGILTIFHKGPILLSDHFVRTLAFMFIGLASFYLFSRSKNDISRKEGLILLLIYILFIFVETIN